MTNTTIFATIALTSILLLGTSIVQAADHEDGPSLGMDHDTSTGPVPTPYPNIANADAKAIPDWVKFTMQAYLDGNISETELLNALQFLEDNGIMSKSQKAAQLLADLRDEVADLKKKLDVDGIVGPNTWPAGDNVPPGSQIAPSQSKVIVMSASAAAECTGVRSAPFIPGGQVVQGEISDVQVLVSPPGDSPSSEDPFNGQYYVAGATHTYTNEDGNRFLMVPIPQVFGGSDENSSCWVRVAQVHASGEEIWTDEYGATSGDPDRPIITGSVPNPEHASDMTLKGSKIHENAPADDRPAEEVAFYFNKISSASETVHDLVTNGETSTTGWDEGVAVFTSKNYDATTDGTHELGHALGMINNAIEKEIQTIEGEITILGDLMNMFTSSSSSPARATSQYSESDFEFISRYTSQIDTKIQSLQTGLSVLDEMLSTAGDDAQLANTDLQNAISENQDMLDSLEAKTTQINDDGEFWFEDLHPGT